jgi:steroid delta-isomerase
LRPERIHVRGDRAAVSWSAEGHSATGKDIAFEGINLFEVDASGKILSMTGYWDLEGVIAQM